MGALRPGTAGHARTVDDPGPGPLPALQGTRPGRLLRRPRRQGLHPRDRLDTWAPGPARSGTTRTGCGCPAWRSRPAPSGHGLPLAVGVALGLRAQGLTTPRVYVLLGDAELDEGSNHEAIAYAGAAGLDRLTAIVMDNESATHGWPGGIASRFTVNGWTAVDRGRARPRPDRGRRCAAHSPARPHVVVAQYRDRKGDHHAYAFYRETATLLDRDPRTALVLADISAAAFAPVARAATRTGSSTSASGNS